MKKLILTSLIAMMSATGGAAFAATTELATTNFVRGGVAAVRAEVDAVDGKVDTLAGNLGTAAFADAADFDAAGTAASAVSALATNINETVQDHIMNKLPGAITSAMATQMAGKANIAVPATAGNVAKLDANGNLIDGGTLGTAAFVNTGAFDAAGTAAGLVGALGTAASRDVATGIASGNNNLATSGQVASAIAGIDVATIVNNAIQSGDVQIDVSDKADKVDGATSGNVAGLDSNGNLTDSGIASAAIATAITQAGSALQAGDITGKADKSGISGTAGTLAAFSGTNGVLTSANVEIVNTWTE